MRFKKVALLYGDVIEATITVPSPPSQPPDEFIALMERLVSQMRTKDYFDIQCNYSNAVGLSVSGKKEITDADRPLIEEKLKEYQFPDQVYELVLFDSAA